MSEPWWNTPTTPSATSQHPTLDWEVTPQQRARVEDYLQRAYVEGRLSKSEFDSRIATAMAATTRRDLNATLEGLATVPVRFPGQQDAGYAQVPGYGGVSYGRTALAERTFYGAPVRSGEGTGVGAAAHFLALPTWLFGPGLVAAATTKGTPAHREAAKAFNATLSGTVLVVLVSVASRALFGHGGGWITSLVMLGWIASMIIGGIKASNGENFRNPFTRVIPVRALSER